MPTIKKDIELNDLTKSQRKQFDLAIRHINNGKRVCLYSEAGTGKTTMVGLIAKVLRRKVIEYNASDSRTKNDIAKILRRIRTFKLKKVIYLFDEVDCFKNWTQLKNILKFSAHPVMMTCNDYWKIPDSLKKDPKVKWAGVRIYQPKKSEVSAFLKKQGATKSLSKINFDWRSSVNAVMAGGDTYGANNYYRDLKVIARDAKSIMCYPETVPEIIERHKSSFGRMYFWVLDNIPKFYRGKDLYDAIEKLANAELLNCPELLAFLPKGRGDKAEYPHFFKKQKIYGKRKKKTNPNMLVSPV
jgi:SpoVK/Ycf46/Vps4 family AAA+-type ATPase